MKNRKINWTLISFILTVFLTLIVLLIIWTWERPVSPDWPIDYTAFGTYGDFFGGVFGTLFAAIGVVFVYFTYIKQSVFQKKDQIESRFFELLKLHEKNVEELKKIDDKIFTVYIKNIRSFVSIIKDYNDIESKNWNGSTMVKLGYLYFFYGASEYTSERLTGLPINSSEVTELNNYIKKLGIDYKGSFEEFGKYFRQLFQIVTYIDNKDILTYTDKEQYVKSLRVRLNIEEQYLLFLNSLVANGLDWEKAKSEEKDQLITKYNLLKNIPNEYNQVAGISFLLEYPNIHYEFMGDNKSTERIRLEKIYNAKMNFTWNSTVKLFELLLMKFELLIKYLKTKYQMLLKKLKQMLMV